MLRSQPEPANSFASRLAQIVSRACAEASGPPLSPSFFGALDLLAEVIIRRISPKNPTYERVMMGLAESLIVEERCSEEVAVEVVKAVDKFLCREYPFLSAKKSPFAEFEGRPSLDVCIEQGLKHARAALQKDSHVPSRQDDLAISHDKIGDMLAAAGERERALTEYRASFAIHEKLVVADPANAQWQRALSVTRARIGDMLAAAGDWDGALAEYRASFTIFEKLVVADPGNAQWQRDLAYSRAKVAALRKGRSQKRQNSNLVSDETVQDSFVPGETITPAGEPGSPRPRSALPVPEAGHELTRPAQTPAVEWPAAGWQKLRDQGGAKKMHAIVDYLRVKWKPFLNATGAAVTLEILEQKDPGAGTALRRYLERHPMPEELRFIRHDEVMHILADRPTRLVDVASCRRRSPGVQ